MYFSRKTQWIGMAMLLLGGMVLIWSLARISPPDSGENPLVLKSMKLLEKALRDTDPFVRSSAAKALSDSGIRKVAPLVEMALSDPYPTARLFAIEGLSEWPIAEAHRFFSMGLTDPDPSVRLTTVRVIAERWPNAHLNKVLRSLLERSAEDEDRMVSMASVAALGLEDDRSRMKAFQTALSDPHEEIRLGAAFALGLTQEKAAVPLLLEALLDPVPSVRAHAAKALGRQAHPEGIPGLIRSTQDSDPIVRSLAITALSSFKTPEISAPIRSATADPDGFVRLSAGIALVKMGDPQGYKWIEAALRDPDYGIRSGAARSLGEAFRHGSYPVEVPRAIELVKPLIHDDVERVRAATVRALGMFGRRDEIPILTEALKDASPSVRCYAAGAVLHIMSRLTTDGGSPA